MVLTVPCYDGIRETERYCEKTSPRVFTGWMGGILNKGNNLLIKKNNTGNAARQALNRML